MKQSLLVQNVNNSFLYYYHIYLRHILFELHSNPKIQTIEQKTQNNATTETCNVLSFKHLINNVGCINGIHDETQIPKY